MLGPGLQENSPDEFRVTSRYEHEAQNSACAGDQLLELLARHQLAIAFSCLHQEKVAFVLVQVVVVADGLRGVQDAMPTEMDTDRLILQHTLQVVDAALATAHLHASIRHR